MITALAHGGKRIAGIDISERAGIGRIRARQRKFLSNKFRGAESILRAHANAVHGGGVIMRRRNLCEDRLRGDPIKSVVDGNFLGR